MRTNSNEPTTTRRPNVLVIFVDQQRWDTLGVYGSPMDITPHLDAAARRGVRFERGITTQPVCAPARACLLTGQYATTHGVWRNGLGLTGDEQTLASCFSAAGYETGYVGKWHLAPHESGPGAVPARYRAGFADFWEAANVLEFVSRPDRTVLYDAEGQEVRPPGYRVDAMTDRVIHFLRQEHARPFFFMVSYLEPHHQNDLDQYVAPDGYAERYKNPHVPGDLRALPGTWYEHLPGYYGIVASIDENVGRIVRTLDEQGIADDTIVVFTSDHGCHFRTRNAEYKRSCHDSSVRVPLLVWGPGFDRRLIVPEPVGTVDLAPTLLDAAGVPIPASMQGHSLLPLVRRETGGGDHPPEEVFIQISESQVGRALRSERWTYGVVAPDKHGGRDAASDVYVEAYLYDTFADPHQLVNLLGRRGYGEMATTLRARLVARMAEAGEGEPSIRPYAGSPM
jgi:arylsulfatase A-like enzyme